MNFKKYVQIGEAFVREIAVEMDCPDDISKAGQVLRSVLHALRNQSIPEECFQLISKLPMRIKAVFVDGWRISGKGQRVRNIEDFRRTLPEALRPLLR